MKHILLALLISASAVGSAQTITQTVNGSVADVDSKAPLAGVAIWINTEVGKLGAVTDQNGDFSIQDVPIGRQTLHFSYVGYEEKTVSNLLVTSGKQPFIRVEMNESSEEIEAIRITGHDKTGSVNEMATVSSRTFEAEQTERYPGSRQDPARMASNFAGVQGTDDSRNDLVIRGNSPIGLLWRFEGIDIPSPSHFSIAGSTGGPLSILNNKVIGASDFMTSAFPAEYGNALSGVFDVRLRNGNYNEHEFSAQVGLFGLELMAEGPINKETKATYMATYRYSTFTVFNALNVDLGTDATPRYDDVTFKLNFPGKNNNTLSIWGIGGRSNIDIVFSEDTVPSNDLYGENDRDQYFTTNMFATGMTYKKFFKNKASITAILSQSGQYINSIHNFIYWDSAALTENRLQLDRLRQVQGYTQYEGRTAAHVKLNKKVNARLTYRVGAMMDVFQLNYVDSARGEFSGDWVTKLDTTANPLLARAYVSAKYRINGRLTANGGLYSQHWSQSGNAVLEPRVGLVYNLSQSSKISAAYGLHSRSQPLYIYYVNFVDSATKTFDNHNEKIENTRSHHWVVAYDRVLNDHWRLKAETYYQRLFNVPVEEATSSFSLLNQGSGFQRFFPGVLENTGTGENYGIELTLEKFFSKNYFLLLTGSVFESFYTGSDGVKRDTDFNGNFVFNALGGFEKAVGKKQKNSISLGSKFTWAGGRRYSPVDVAATQADGIYVQFIESQRNQLQFKDYIRWDMKLGYKINGQKVTHEIAFDVINVLDRENILTIVYANDPDRPGQKQLVEQPQLGLLPVFYYKIDF